MISVMARTIFISFSDGLWLGEKTPGAESRNVDTRIGCNVFAKFYDPHILSKSTSAEKEELTMMNECSTFTPVPDVLDCPPPPSSSRSRLVRS